MFSYKDKLRCKTKLGYGNCIHYILGSTHIGQANKKVIARCGSFHIHVVGLALDKAKQLVTWIFSNKNLMLMAIVTFKENRLYIT